MKAIKVFIDKCDTIKMVSFVPELNNHEELAAVIVNPDEFVVASYEECSMAWAKSCIAKEFEDYSVETIK